MQRGRLSIITSHLTFWWCVEATLRLYQLIILQEDQSAIEMAILTSDVLHRVLPCELTDPLPHHFTPTQVPSNREIGNLSSNRDEFQH